MGAAAQFCGEIPHLDHAYGVTVFLTEQGHCPCFLGLLQGHGFSHHRKGCLNLPVDQRLYLLNLLRCHG